MLGLAIATDQIILVAMLILLLGDLEAESTRAQSEAIAISAFTVAFTVHAVLAEAWIRATRRRSTRPIRDDPRPGQVNLKALG